MVLYLAAIGGTGNQSYSIQIQDCTVLMGLASCRDLQTYDDRGNIMHFPSPYYGRCWPEELSFMCCRLSNVFPLSDSLEACRMCGTQRTIQRQQTTYIVDAADKRLGRLASTVAVCIRGKNLATFTPWVDMGAYVVVINAEKVGVTGRKSSQKLYKRHLGRPGGMKQETFSQLQKTIPQRIVEHAIEECSQRDE